MSALKWRSVGKAGRTISASGRRWRIRGDGGHVTSFKGEARHSLDAKGRVIMPKKLREDIGEQSVILTKGIDRCLFLFTPEQYEQVETSLQDALVPDPKARAIQRSFYAGVTESELDAQGRITIPPVLRAYAALDRDVVFVRVSRRVEVWSEERWREYQESADRAFSEMSEEIPGAIFKV